MAATRSNNPNVVITTAQLKSTLNGIIQNNQNISTYKWPVLQAIRQYLNEIDARIWVTTNPQRLRRVHDILNHIDDYDLAFLTFALNQTLDIDNAGSSLRDNVGKVALDQFMRVLAGLVECALAIPSTILLVTGAYSNSTPSCAIRLFIALVCIGLILVTDHLYNSFTTGLKKSDHLPTSVNAIIKDIGKTKVSEVLCLPVQMLDKSIADTCTSVSNIGSNIGDTAQSHLFFFRQRQANAANPVNPVPPQQANAANPVNPVPPQQGALPAPPVATAVPKTVPAPVLKPAPAAVLPPVLKPAP